MGRDQSASWCTRTDNLKAVVRLALNPLNGNWILSNELIKVELPP